METIKTIITKIHDWFILNILLSIRLLFVKDKQLRKNIIISYYINTAYGREMLAEAMVGPIRKLQKPYKTRNFISAWRKFIDVETKTIR